MKKIIPTLAVIAVAGILVSCGATTPEQIPLSPKVPAPAAEVTPVTDPTPVAPVPAVEMNVTASGVSVNGSGVTAPGVVVTENSITAPGVVVTENSITAPGVMVTATGIVAPGVVVSDTNGIVATGANVSVTLPSADVDTQIAAPDAGTTTSSN